MSAIASSPVSKLLVLVTLLLTGSLLFRLSLARVAGQERLPLLLISEFMADPKAVSDSVGEWFEIYNPGGETVNLRGWQVADLDGDRHLIEVDLLIAPGQYLVLARNGDPAANGGVEAAYVYGNAIQLANGSDELLLIGADGVESDRVVWGSGTDLGVPTGASLERADLLRMLRSGELQLADGERAARWVVAETVWPGSAGDRGSPGQPYAGSATPPATGTPQPSPSPATGTPSPTRTATGTATPAVTVAPTVTGPATPTASGSSTPTVPATPPPASATADPFPTATATVDSTATASATLSPTATGSAGRPRLLFSEFLADPRAVADAVGEWFELYNPGPEPVNLRGWIVADLGGDWHRIEGDLWAAPDAYLVLARNADPAVNGGVTAAYSYGNGLQLANGADELLLYDADGGEVDRVEWGSGGLRVTAGASLERTDVTADAVWVTAHTPWPGSAGDRGSPGSPYQPPAEPTPPTTTTATPTAAATVTATPAPTGVGTPRPTSSPSTTATVIPSLTAEPTPPARWIPVSASPLLVDELYYRGTDQEFIVLRNAGSTPLDLAGWAVGDAERPGDGEGMLALPAGHLLAPGALFVLARSATAFQARWQRWPDAEVEATAAGVPTLARRSDLARGVLALNDGGDEVVVLNPEGQLADAVAYGRADYAALGLVGELRSPAGDYSLQRVVEVIASAEQDLRHRYLFGPPDPFQVRSVPQAAPLHFPPLDQGLWAVWGSLGSRTTFTPGSTAAPAYLLAAAAAHGLGFVALADPAEQVAAQLQGLVLPAAAALPVRLDSWAWQGGDGARAVVYGLAVQPAVGASELTALAESAGALLQWQTASVPASAAVVALAADSVGHAFDLNALQRHWLAGELPWLPAGNANPPLPGEVDPAPRYTGLAVRAVDEAGVRAALAARRGWLTNRPGLWLTLRAQPADGPAVWMGQTVAAGGSLLLEIAYGDGQGEPAGLALWRDRAPLLRLDRLPLDGRWQVAVDAHPGALYYAVASQADGDFAVTAPLRVREAAPLHPPPAAPTPPPGTPTLSLHHGQATGPPGSLAAAKVADLGSRVGFRAAVTAPPGLFNAAIYVAEEAPAPGGGTAGLGIQVYLRRGDFPELAEGDLVLVEGRLHSFRGELELLLDEPAQIWREGPALPLAPLPVTVGEIGESLEGRLVTFEGRVSGWQWDSFFLVDPAQPEEPPVRVTVRSSLPWRRPYVNPGERWQVTGLVSQLGRAAPWTDGYRVLVRYPSDLERLARR